MRFILPILTLLLIPNMAFGAILLNTPTGGSYATFSTTINGDGDPSCKAANQFTVPVGKQWSITGVGNRWAKNSATDSITVDVYSDTGTEPNVSIAAGSTISNAGLATFASFTEATSTFSASIAAGTYWMVYGRTDDCITNTGHFYTGLYDNAAGSAKVYNGTVWSSNTFTITMIIEGTESDAPPPVPGLDLILFGF